MIIEEVHGQSVLEKPDKVAGRVGVLVENPSDWVGSLAWLKKKKKSFLVMRQDSGLHLKVI